jgi:hypothetical protein
MTDVTTYICDHTTTLRTYPVCPTHVCHVCAVSYDIRLIQWLCRGDGDFPLPTSDQLIPNVNLADIIWASGTDVQHHDVHQRWYTNLPADDSAAWSNLCMEAASDLWSFMNHGTLKVTSHACACVCVCACAVCFVLSPRDVDCQLVGNKHLSLHVHARPAVACACLLPLRYKQTRIK